MAEISMNRLTQILNEVQKHLENGRLKGAAEIIFNILVHEPDNKQIFNFLITITELYAKVEYTEQVFRRLFNYHPNNPDILDNLAMVLKKQRRYAEAREYLDKSLAQNPVRIETLVILGSLQLGSGNYSEAIDTYKKIIDLHNTNNTKNLNPKLIAAVYANLALALSYKGNFIKALEANNLSLALEESPEVYRNRALNILASGNLKDGFYEYEWRKKCQDVRAKYEWYTNGKPYWQGEIFSEKRLLIHHEQGLGDSLFFIRYLPTVKKRGGTVILSAPKSLIPLYGKNSAIDVLIEHDYNSANRISYDLVIPLMSLPYIFGTTLKTIPTDIPYITVDPKLTLAWRKKIFEKDGNSGNLRVGLVWAASNTNADGLTKTCKLADMSPLVGINGVTYFSLQIGDASQEVRNFPASMNVFDLTEDICNFADTAAFIANLDLIISVDTSVAHLAGAMGKQSWTLLRYNSGWMWFADREDSLWYPTMRLFRQPSPGDWASVIGQVEKELQHKINLLRI